MPSSVIVTSKHFLSAPECCETVRAWTCALGYTHPVARLRERRTRPPGHAPRMQSGHLWVLLGLATGLDQPGAQVPGSSPGGPRQGEGHRMEPPVGPGSPPASAGRDPGGGPAPAGGPPGAAAPASSPSCSRVCVVRLESSLTGCRGQGARAHGEKEGFPRGSPPWPGHICRLRDQAQLVLLPTRSWVTESSHPLFPRPARTGPNPGGPQS